MLKNIIFAVIAVSAAACSGGDPSNQSAKTAGPTVHAGADQTIFEGVTAVLNAQIENEYKFAKHTITWEQLDGPEVTLSGTTGTRPIFSAPMVDSPTSFVFKISVDDGVNPPVSDEVTITVVDVEEDVA